MSRRDGLGVAGRRALLEAAALLGESDVERYREAVQRYARAVDLADEVRRAWEDAGRPYVSSNPNGANGVHPLLKTLRDCEADAARFAAQIRLTPDSQRGRAGRPVGATSAPDRMRKAPPAVKLRVAT